MNGYTLRDNGGNKWQRVNKTTARKAYDAGDAVHLAPCNLMPFGPWHIGMTIKAEPTDSPTYEGEFAERIQAFTYYNCTNETGRYPAYYLEVK